MKKKVAGTSGLAKNIDCNTKIKEIQHKIPNVTGLFSQANFNTKVTEIENKIPNVAVFVKIRI